jgi:hypothetical protein
MYNEIIKNDRLLHFKIVEIVEEYRLKYIYAKTGLDKCIKERGWEYMESQLKKRSKDNIIRA